MKNTSISNVEQNRTLLFFIYNNTRLWQTDRQKYTEKNSVAREATQGVA